MAHSAMRCTEARPKTALVLLVLLALSTVAASAAAQSGRPGTPGCEEEGKNMQCTTFGQISMVNQLDVRGEPVDVTVETVVEDTFERAGARWIMYSIRHDAPGGDSPVNLEVKEFTSPHGDMYTTRVDHDVPNEINLWVHVVDIPVGETVTLTVRAEVADRGAFKIETLVMPFDRGYEPLRNPDGSDRTLYASTLLGVNQETGGGDDNPFGDGLRTPGPAIPLVAVAVAGLAVAARRRSK